MKIKSFFVLLFALGITLNAQNKNPNYNAEVAAKYGGDEYGMKNYVLAMLQTPPDSVRVVKMTNDLMKGHLANINKLVKEEKLIVAGPFGENTQRYRGLFIFDVATVEEAKALVATDPAVQAGVFDVVYIPWYGSAALKGYLEDSDKIWVVQP